MEGDTLLAVVDVEVVRNHMFAQHKAIAKALRSDVAQRVVVVLVA